MVAITHPGTFTARPVRGARPARAAVPAVYRRRRLAAAGLLALLLAVGLLLVDVVGAALDRGTAEPSFGGERVAEVSVVVEPGDTVWSIAAALAPGDDPRPVVDALVAANGGSALQVGQRLVLRLP